MEALKQVAAKRLWGRVGARARAGIYTVPGIVLLALSVIAMAGISGCRTSPYHLPAPAQPARDGTGADQVDEAALDRAARASLMKLYELLRAQQYEPAERYLSQETREFLTHITRQADAATALASRKMTLQGQAEITFDPVQLLLGGNIAEVRDAMDGVAQAETPNRRELFVIDPQGKAHRVILIREGGEWVLHKTSVGPSAPLSTPAS